MTTRRVPLVAGLLLAAAVLTGCVAPQPSPSASSPTSPSPAEHTGDPAALVTHAAFRGDCATLIGLDALAVAAGVASSPASVSAIDLASAAGGIGCSWLLGRQGGEGAQIVLQAIAAASGDSAALAAADHAWACEESDDLVSSNSGCTTSAVVGDWWYQLRVYTFTSAGGQRDAANSVDDALRDALDAEAPAVAAGLLVDCESLGDQVDLAGTGLESAPFKTRSPDPGPFPVEQAASRAVGTVACSAEDGDADAAVAFEVDPGSVGRAEACASATDASAVEVAGAAAAFEFPVVSGAAMLCIRSTWASVLFRGAPSLSGDGESPAWDDRHRAFASRLVAALDAQLGAVIDPARV